MHFVYTVLLLNKASSVEKFRLNCNQIYGHSHINSWIRSAVERGLSEATQRLLIDENIKDFETGWWNYG